jgi:hypothetical protein
MLFGLVACYFFTAVRAWNSDVHGFALRVCVYVCVALSGFETADMAPRLSKAAADSKAAVDRASESLRARRMAIESAKLETLIETLGTPRPAR